MSREGLRAGRTAAEDGAVFTEEQDGNSEGGMGRSRIVGDDRTL